MGSACGVFELAKVVGARADVSREHAPEVLGAVDQPAGRDGEGLLVGPARGLNVGARPVPLDRGDLVVHEHVVAVGVRRDPVDLQRGRVGLEDLVVGRAVDLRGARQVVVRDQQVGPAGGGRGRAEGLSPARKANALVGVGAVVVGLVDLADPDVPPSTGGPGDGGKGGSIRGGGLVVPGRAVVGPPAIRSLYVNGRVRICLVGVVEPDPGGVDDPARGLPGGRELDEGSVAGADLELGVRAVVGRLLARVHVGVIRRRDVSRGPRIKGEGIGGRGRPVRRDLGREAPGGLAGLLEPVGRKRLVRRLGRVIDHRGRERSDRSGGIEDLDRAVREGS